MPYKVKLPSKAGPCLIAIGPTDSPKGISSKNACSQRSLPGPMNFARDKLKTGSDCNSQFRNVNELCGSVGEYFSSIFIRTFE